jgi:hypothetical protein
LAAQLDSKPAGNPRRLSTFTAQRRPLIFTPRLPDRILTARRTLLACRAVFKPLGSDFKGQEFAYMTATWMSEVASDD